MENKNAVAIDAANVGKLVQYHENGWRIGTLVEVAADNITVKPLVKGNAKAFKRDDVRLIITEAPKGKTVGVVNVPGIGSVPLVEAPKAKPAKAAKAEKPTAKKPATPEVEVPALPEKPEKEFPLTATEDANVFFGKAHGKKCIVCFGERNRAVAAARFASVTFSERKIKAAKALAKKEDAPLYYGLQVRVGGKLDSGWLISARLFDAHAQSTADFSLTVKARAAYIADGDTLQGVRFMLPKEAK